MHESSVMSDKHPLLNPLEGECHVAQEMHNARLLVVNGRGLRWRRRSSVAPPTGLAYPTNLLWLAVGTDIGSVSPQVQSGVVTNYSVSPALPAGLSLNVTSGVITGTPLMGDPTNNLPIGGK